VVALVAPHPQPVGDHRAGAVPALLHRIVAEVLGQQPRTRDPVVAQQRPHALHRRVDGALDLDRDAAPEPGVRRPSEARWIGRHTCHRFVADRCSQVTAAHGPAPPLRRGHAAESSPRPPDLRLADYCGVWVSVAAGAGAPGVSLAAAAASVVAGAAPNSGAPAGVSTGA
jgi:hypothetical protein